MKNGTCPACGGKEIYSGTDGEREGGDARQQLHTGLALPGRGAGQLRLRPVRLRTELRRQGEGSPGGHQEEVAAGHVKRVFGEPGIVPGERRMG